MATPIAVDSSAEESTGGAAVRPPVERERTDRPVSDRPRGRNKPEPPTTDIDTAADQTAGEE